MSHLAILSQQSTQARAASRVGYEVEVARDLAYTRLSFGSPGNSKPLNELTAAADAHGMLKSAMGSVTYQRARTFLAALPFGTPPPEFSVDPDGEIAIEWYEGENVLSISLSFSGRVSYVFEHDGNVSSDTGYFSSAISDGLLEMINTFQ